MEILTRTVENLKTRAKFVPSTLNEEARTVDVVFVTENPVRTYDWMAGEVVDEILSCDPKNIRKDRFEAGMPVLNNHNRWEGVTSQLGIVENYRFENGQGIATLRLSKREDVNPIWQDIKDGIVRTVSVGYSVHKYEITKEDGKRPQYRAVDWEPLEISFAPVPADAGASVRNKTEIIDQSKTNNNMELKARALAVGLPETATLPEVERAENEKARKENEIKEAARKEAVEAERTRAAEITEAVRNAGLKNEFAAKLIKDGTDINKSRELIINELAKESHEINGSNRGASIQIGKEQVEKTRAAMEDAIIHRVRPTGTLSEAGREFRGMNLLDMARFSLDQAGVSHKGISRREAVMMALNRGERMYMSSSDFPNVLANTLNKTLRMAYDEQSRTFMPFCRRTNLSDFKAVTRNQISNLVGGFDQIPEGGEYKHATLTDGKETYQLAKYGKMISLTWESIINDDLSAFDRVSSAIAATAAQKQSDIVWGIITTNGNMADGDPLFHANHGNLAGSGTTIPNGISAGRAAMRKQTGLEGNFINVTPAYLIVGPDKETEAQQLINATIVATKTADTNVFRNSAEIIVEPRLTGNQWYLAAKPSQIDTIEYAFLDGEPELFTEQEQGFERDGLCWKARMIFAAKAIDHRGLYKNAGA